MEDIGPTVDLLFISKYKRQLLEMVEEMKELRNAHAKKTEECQRLRSKVDALQEKLWTKDAEVADNTLKNEASADSLILAEKLQLQTKEIDELRVKRPCIVNCFHSFCSLFTASLTGSSTESEREDEVAGGVDTEQTERGRGQKL